MSQRDRQQQQETSQPIRTDGAHAAKPDVPVQERTAKPQESTSASAIAKWLVPSVTALFIVTGYIVQSAQQELLGLFYSTNDSTSLFVSSAEFIREVIGFPLTLIKAVMDGSLFREGTGFVLLLATGITLAVLILPKTKKFPGFGGAWLPILLLFLLIGGKFVLLDEPLTHVRNIVLTWGEIEDDRPIIERIRGNDPGHSEAESIIRDIICSRIGDLAATDQRLQVSSLCRDESVNPDERRARRAAGLRQRLIAQIWSALLILAVVLAVVRRGRDSSLASAVGVLAILYTLTVPYAYGKLRKSTYFDLGTVRLVEPAGGSPPEGRNDVQALILSRTASGAVLLVTRPLECATRLDVPGPGADLPEQDPDDRTTVALAFYPNSQIEAIERISRFDVIAWSYNNEYSCPLQGPQV